VSNFRNKRIIGIRICKQRAYGQQHLPTPHPLQQHNFVNANLLKAVLL
jgi:hypothetical protein